MPDYLNSLQQREVTAPVKTILLVDDSADVRHVVRTFLERDASFKVCGEFRRCFSVETFTERIAFINPCGLLRSVSYTLTTAMFHPVLLRGHVGGTAFL